MPFTVKNDKTGMQFGTLKVLHLVPKQQGDTSRHWKCFCTACKKVVLIKSEKLRIRKGKRLSCGCKRYEWIATASITHGATGTREFKAWAAAKGRCKWNRNYRRNGIKVCPRWIKSFKRFLTDMGKCPVGFSLERKNNRKGYSPKNCVWADRLTQANNKRGVKKIRFNGKSQTISQWARELNMSKDSLYQRLYQGWPVKLAFTTPKLVGGRCNTVISRRRYA